MREFSTMKWIVADLQLAQWHPGCPPRNTHPGYFLPTVAGGLIAAAGSAALGYGAALAVPTGRRLARGTYWPHGFTSRFSQ
jgi:hypothetical protein